MMNASRKTVDDARLIEIGRRSLQAIDDRALADATPDALRAVGAKILNPEALFANTDLLRCMTLRRNGPYALRRLQRRG